MKKIPLMYKQELLKAAQWGQDFGAGTANTVNYDTIEEMVDDRISFTNDTIFSSVSDLLKEIESELPVYAKKSPVFQKAKSLIE